MMMTSVNDIQFRLRSTIDTYKKLKVMDAVLEVEDGRKRHKNQTLSDTPSDKDAYGYTATKLDAITQQKKVQFQALQSVLEEIKKNGVVQIETLKQDANLNEVKRIQMIRDLHNLSNDFKNVILNIEKQIKDISLTLNECNNLFILGKGTDEFIAKEGSLKIKEISYIHSEGYSASSLKHGPFALLDENFPTIIINCHNEHTSKILNCYEEVNSRNSPIIIITNNHLNLKCKVVNVIKNHTYESLLGIIPLQLLAYYLSINRGINPDIPKNLAKVVTVE